MSKMKSHTKRYIFRSPHPVEECYRRFNESVDTSLFSYFSSKQFAGKVSTKCISVMKRDCYLNSFRPVLRASLHPNTGGTDIISTIGLHPFVKVFLFIWFGLLFIIGGTMFVRSFLSFFLESYPIDVGSIMGILIPPNIALFGVILLIFGKYLARNEFDEIKQFITDLLDAEEIEQDE